jgi:putative ABC transport system permease protein
MRNFKEYIYIGFDNLKAYRLRSTLSLIGIIIGIAAVIAVASMGEGSKARLRQQIKKWGTEILNIRPNRSHRGNMKQGLARSSRNISALTENDLLSIKRNASFVSDITSVINSQCEINKRQVNVWGIDEGYQGVATVNILQGRFIDRRDITNKRNICAIEMNTNISKFFKGLPKIGGYLYLWNMPFKIVGLVEREALKRGYIDNSIDVYIPIDILKGKESTMKSFFARAVSEDKLQQAAYEIETILQSRRLGNKMYKARFSGNYQKEANEMLQTITLVIGGIAFLSLLVGGIGIMNMMLISVGERTKEIGVRKALGAERIDIITQFLIEAIILCIIGGIIGIVMGLIIAWIAAPLLQLPFIISWKVVAIGASFAVSVGILSGLYPALKASKLSPIEALRYE